MKTYTSLLVQFLYLSLLVCLIGSVSLFWIGYHNSDLGHNMAYINADSGNDYVDQGVDGQEYEAYDLITIGNKGMIVGFFASMCFSFGLGLSCIRRQD